VCRAISAREDDVDRSRPLHLFVNSLFRGDDTFEENAPPKEEETMLVKILEVWFFGSAPIAIAVGKALNRVSASQ
jgi:hypothetical protein